MFPLDTTHVHACTSTGLTNICVAITYHVHYKLISYDPGTDFFGGCTMSNIGLKTEVLVKGPYGYVNHVVITWGNDNTLESICIGVFNSIGVFYSIQHVIY